MPNEKYLNELRSFRRELNLTQDDVAFLVDIKGHATVAKHESGEHPPMLDHLICYELLFERPLFELFARRYRDIAGLFQERVNGAIFLLERQNQNELTKFKIAKLKAILGEGVSDSFL